MKMRTALCDDEPSVMFSSLNYFLEEIKVRPNDFKDLVDSLL